MSQPLFPTGSDFIPVFPLHEMGGSNFMTIAMEIGTGGNGGLRSRQHLAVFDGTQEIILANTSPC